MTIIKAVIQCVRLEYGRKAYDKHSFFNIITSFLCVQPLKNCWSTYIYDWSKLRITWLLFKALISVENLVSVVDAPLRYASQETILKTILIPIISRLTKTIVHFVNILY